MTNRPDEEEGATGATPQDPPAMPGTPGGAGEETLAGPGTEASADAGARGEPAESLAGAETDADPAPDAVAAADVGTPGEPAETLAGAATDADPAPAPDEVAAADDGAPGEPAAAPAVDAETPPGATDDPETPPDPTLLAEAVRIAEALIFASDRPVTTIMLGTVLPDGITAAAATAALAEACEGRGVVLMEVAGGWAFRTAPDLAQRLTKVVQAPRRLPRAAMEALSVIAYHQPCTRGEIEEIRGATLSQTTLEALLELGLIAPRGRREVPGRPTLWGTTPRFLEQFGLRALSDLPRKEELVTAETGPALPLAPLGAPPPAEPPAAKPGTEDADRPSDETGDTPPSAPEEPA